MEKYHALICIMQFHDVSEDAQESGMVVVQLSTCFAS